MRCRLSKLVVGMVSAASSLGLGTPTPAGALVSVTLASTGPQGQIPDGSSFLQDVTADGEMLFLSTAQSFLEPGQTNFARLYLGDGGPSQLLTPVVSFSVERAGISDNGRYVAFVYSGTSLDLAPGIDGLSFDPNGQQADIFLYDQADHTTRRMLAVGTADAIEFVQTTTIDVSDDGRYIVFDTTTGLVPEDTNGMGDVYRFDRQDAGLDWVSAGAGGALPDGASSRPRSTPDGTVVVFGSSATNLVADDTNGVDDVFVWEAPGATTRVSTDPTGNQLSRASGTGADVSDDGRYVVFSTSDPAVTTFFSTSVIRKDRVTGETLEVSAITTDGRFSAGGRAPTLSGDGRVVAYEADWTRITTGQFGARADVVVRDLDRQDVELISRSLTDSEADGQAGEAVVAAAGEVVGFTSNASDLVSPTPERPGDSTPFAVYRAERLPDDAVPPVAVIASPIDGATFALGSPGTVSYACADNLALAPVDPCTGSVPDGSPLDTTSPGPRTVTVTATDSVGLIATAVAHYSVSSELDDPFATGSLISLDPGLTVSVTDAADPADGVTVSVGPGTGRATFRVCGGFTVRVAAGSTVTITCGSVTLKVAAGTGEVVLDDGATVVAVSGGSTATVDRAPGGEPTIVVATGSATVTGTGSPAATLTAGGSGPGAATYLCRGRVATIVGTSGADKLQGTNRADVVVGLGGADKVEAGGGDDTICGGEGNDTAEAGDGSDTVDGGSGGDKISGGKGNDTLLGGAGDDTIEGGGGVDTINGGDGRDKCSASAASPPRQGCER